MFDPSPFEGGCLWIASPMQNTRPLDVCVAYMLLTVQVETWVISIGIVSSPINS